MKPSQNGIDELGNLPAHLHQLDEIGVAEAIVSIDFYILQEHTSAVFRIGAQSTYTHADDIQRQIADAKRIFVQIVDQKFRVGSHAVLLVVEDIGVQGSSSPSWDPSHRQIPHRHRPDLRQSGRSISHIPKRSDGLSTCRRYVPVLSHLQ